jgi:hypothetical protein
MISSTTSTTQDQEKKLRIEKVKKQAAAAVDSAWKVTPTTPR